MPEIKNTFIQSKMNKDMDGRILPNGQYRDGRNVQISRSEGDDVGALENVLGNDLLNDFGFTNDNLEIIGHLMADTLDTIFLFLTDYYDSSADQLSNNIAGITGECYIVSYNVRTQTPTILVEGNFLNFSKSHPILGVTLIESLLFWTDNRNQPRKINVELATPGYYTTEDHISVAKYYPYDPILLLNPVQNINYRFESSMRDVVSRFLPPHAAARVDSVDIAAGTVVLNGSYTNIMPSTAGSGTANGDLMSGFNVQDNEQCIVESVSVTAPTTTIAVPPLYIQDLLAGDIVYFQRQNPDYTAGWTGDTNYLKDKFARFSYRFKFDDGEYSLSAPFTQLAFVPQQDGYFIGDKAQNDASLSGDDKIRLVGQESEAFDSTIVKFMENKINDIVLNIPSPTFGNANTSMLWNEANAKLKIVEIDILYKEAQSNKTTIVDTLLIEDFSINSTNLTYNYQSKKPWKTLPPKQTTRVTDVVPIRALAQETSGNRIIYGNFIDKHSSPVNLNYQIQVNEKVSLPSSSSDPTINNPNYYVRKEYQNHTLKQNRNYQVGIILSDRYGRQSNVILSSIINSDIVGNTGATFYHPYKSVEDPILTDKYPEWPDTSAPINPPFPDPTTWPGDQMEAIFWSIIPEAKTQDGYPGIYSIADGTVVTAIVTNSNIPSGIIGGCTFTSATIENKDGTKTADVIVNVDVNGNVTIQIISSDTGWYNNETFTVVWSGLVPGPSCDPAGPPAWNVSGFVETAKDNPLGWYSYKFVVKQTQQEYYNVYLPGALAGYPVDQAGTAATDAAPDPIPEFKYPKGQERKTCHIVLFGDNVNKVPKDLQDVGPVAESFPSSEILFGRITTTIIDPGTGITQSSKQYDPEQEIDTAIQIANMTKLDLGDILINAAQPTLPPQFYKANTDPLIARIETNKQFGLPAVDGVGTVLPFGPCLAVYETKPVESLLDIFWESTTSGLISDLNNSIKTDDNVTPTGITEPNISWSESDAYGDYISSTFEAAGALGQGVGPVASIQLVNVTRGDGANVSGQFELEETGGPGTGEYQLKIAPYAIDNEGFLCWEDNIKNTYVFDLEVLYDPGVANTPQIIIPVQKTGYVVNEAPKERNFPPLGSSTGTNTGPGVPPSGGDGIKGNVFDGLMVLSPADGEPSGPNLNTGGFGGCDRIEGELPYGLIRSIGTTNTPPGETPDQKLQMTANSSSADWTVFPGNNGETWNNPDFSGHFTRGLNSTVCPAATCTTLVATTTGFSSNGTPETFQAANGSYGSVPPPPFPRSIYNGLELEYTIPRMYQVSMYLPWYTGYSNTPYWFGRSIPYTEQDTKCGTYEVIFGYNSYIPNSGNLNPDPVPPTNSTQAIYGMPQSPIYWDFDDAQLDPALGGEATVGAKQNNNQHYWKDLEEIRLHQAANPLPAGIPGIMQLQNGYNTFYTVEGPKRYRINVSTGMDSGGGQTGFNVNQFLYCSQIPFNQGNYQFYLGGLDVNGLGPSRQFNNMRFFIKQGPIVQGQGNFTNPRRANLYAGNPDISAAPFSPLNNGIAGWYSRSTNLANIGVLCQQQDSSVFGNTIPPGRYVVTVRVTDKNGQGLPYEWDLPITVPPYWTSYKASGGAIPWCQDGGCG